MTPAGLAGGAGVAEVAAKLDRVRGWLTGSGYGAALFTSQPGVAWVTGGLEDRVVRNEETALVWALVTETAAFLITTNIEQPRLQAEADLGGFELHAIPWYSSGGLAEVAGSLADGQKLTEAPASLRMPLVAAETERLAALGAECTQALEGAMRAWRPAERECDLAARIAGALEERLIFPSVLLVGGAERRRAFRHPVPTASVTGGDVLAVVVGVRGGLNVACSRSASAGSPDPELAARHEAACAVEAAMITATGPGWRWADVLRTGQAAYRDAGFDGEWREHVQGGPIGYLSREFDVVPGTPGAAGIIASTLTMAALIGASGLASPLALLIAGAAMLCCAVAYHRLNNWQASAAAPVEWVARGLSPIIGFAVGILVLMTALTSNIGNITLIGSTVLSLIAPGETNNKPLTWVVATIVCLLVVAIAVLGVRLTIRFEGWVILVEYMIIASLAIWGLETELTSHGHGITAPAWSWFTVSHSPGGSTGLIAGVVIATFLLGGWDSPIYLGDEQQQRRDPGRSVLISITFCTLWVIFLFVCLQGLAPASAITTNSANVLPYLAGRLGPKVFVDLVALAVIASFATTIQSQIVDGSRVMFGMGRDRTVPSALGRVNPRFRTPVAGLIVMGVIPIVALILYLASSSLQKTIVYIDSTGGLLFAGYYVVISLYSIWYYRTVLVRNVREFVLGLLLPLVGAGTLVYVIVKSLPGTATPVKVIAVVLFLVGIPLAWLSKAITRAPFFTTRRERYTEERPQPVGSRTGSLCGATRGWTGTTRSRSTTGPRCGRPGSGVLAEPGLPRGR
jgi:amino acid transporter/Xaa-Pro aminopeptidase